MTTKKFGVLLLAVAITPIISGLLGIVYNLFIYIINAEYFIDYKFLHYNIDSNTPTLLGVATIGWLSNWWAGLIIGFILGVEGLIIRQAKMLKIVANSIGLVFLIAIAIGIIGLVFGGIYMAHYSVNWHVPTKIINRNDFIAVATMSEFTHIGGVVGIIIAIFYQIRAKRKVGS